MSALARRLGFFALVVYGIGDILGAGIYALVGKVIDQAGLAAWASFLFAALTALITGFSYAELSGRYPVSAGAAAYVKRAFPGPWVATLAGVLVLATGISSAATVATAFGGYLQKWVAFPEPLAPFLLVTLISFLAFWGIQESSRVNFFLTFVEVAGLVAVIAVGVSLFSSASLSNFWIRMPQDFHLPAVLSGVTLAFYAYIGFEDLVNLAEESKNPSRDLPRAILIAISVTTLVYLLVCLALLLNVPREEMAGSKTPLLLVFEKAGLSWVNQGFSLVAIMAILNTGLINLIMASRLMYGMAEEGLMPKILAKVHPTRRTPWVGVLTAFVAVLILVYTGALKILAQTTSFLILFVFALVHLSLIRVKKIGGEYRGLRFPVVFPCLGLLLCLGFMTQFPKEVYGRSLIVLALGVLVVLVMKRMTSSNKERSP